MTQTFAPAGPSLEVAPDSIVMVRDEKRLVTVVEQTQNGALITVPGIAELVGDATAKFYQGLDTIAVVDPRTTKVIGNSSARHRSARLWLEATIRKGPLPIDDQLEYQRTAVARAIDPESLRRRILLAGAVGLSKTTSDSVIKRKSEPFASACTVARRPRLSLSTPVRIHDSRSTGRKEGPVS